MKANELKKIIRQLNEAAEAINRIDSDIWECLAENGADLPMAQQLDELAERLAPLMDGKKNGYASRIMCQNDNPGKAIYTDEWHKSFAL